MLMFISLFLFFQREISEFPRPIAVKLCRLIGSVFNFIIRIPKFGPTSKKLGGRGTCKIRRDFGQLQISTADISGTDGDIHNRKDLPDQQQFLPRSAKKDSGEL